LKNAPNLFDIWKNAEISSRVSKVHQL